MKNNGTAVEALRERVLQYIGNLKPEDLVSAAQHLGFTENGEPRIIHFPGGKIKLSTDPADIPPYLPRTAEEEERAWHDDIQRGLEDVAAGRTMPLKDLRKRVSRILSN